MRRSICVVALLAFVAVAAPAPASQQTFAFPIGGNLYSPTQMTLGVADTVCWSPQGVNFSNHPLTFDTADVANHVSGTTDYCPDITGLRPGFYAFHCAIHGQAGSEGSVGGGMAGSFTIPGDNTATPDFSLVQDGAAATFTYDGTADPDESTGDAITSYAWDFDGNGRADATTTAPTVQHTYTANGTFHPAVRVIDKGHVLSAPATHDIVITGIVAPPPPPPPPPPPGGGGGTGGGGGGGGVTDTTPPVVHLSLARSLTVGFRLRLAFTTDEPATARATLRVGRRSARAAHDFTTAGKHALTLKLSKSLLRLLRHRRSATLTLTVTDASGNVTVLKRTLKLRARRP